MEEPRKEVANNKVILAAMHHGLHNIPVIIEIAKDLDMMKINESLAIDVLDNVGRNYSSSSRS